MEISKTLSDVTIVGGGFAGLAAALRLHQAGRRIRILEKRPFFGGRAYSFQDKTTGETLDNGQHLLMGCYHETLLFLKNLGTLDRLKLQENLDLTFAEDAQNFHRLSCPKLPAPLHLAFGLLRFKGLKFKDKLGMARMMRRIKRPNGLDLDAMTVTELLQSTDQTADSIRKFWEPLALGALNESLDLASARLFSEVLRRALLSTKGDSRLALSSVGLSELYAKPAQEYFERQRVPLSFQTQVLKIEKTDAGFNLHTQQGDTVQSKQILLAVPPNALAKILRDSGAEYSDLALELHRFAGSPIVSINLWIEDFSPPQSFIGLIDSPIHWLFNKAKILKEEKATHITLVISGAQDWAAHSKEELVELALRELKKYYPDLNPSRLKHSQVVKEFDATFGTRFGLERFRPGPRTSVPGLFLAGDWTDTGLPATIESAVLSGHCAADEILIGGR